MGVLLTPEYGPRQRVQMILTDAALEPTPMLADAIRPAGNACEGFCPLGALGAATERVICGKRMTVATIDYGKCRKCKNGAGGNIHHPAGKPDRLAAVCVRSSIDVLEREGRIGNRFATALRVREAWTVRGDVDLFKM